MIHSEVLAPILRELGMAGTQISMVLTVLLLQIRAVDVALSRAAKATAKPSAASPALSGSGFGAKGSALTAEIEYQRTQAKKYLASGKPLLWDFDDLLEYAEGTRKIADLVVVTGQGHGSGKALNQREGAVLPTSTRQFLAEEMDPPLEIQEVPSNPGRFVVPRASIEAWVQARGS